MNNNLKLITVSALSAIAISACNNIGGCPTVNTPEPNYSQREVKSINGTYNDELTSIKNKYDECESLIAQKKYSDASQCQTAKKILITEFSNKIKTDQKFNINDVDSLRFYPTTKIPEDQQLIHRIWLGSVPSENSFKVIEEWERAQDQVKDNKFIQPLWLWGAEDLDINKFKPFHKVGSDMLGVYYPNGISNSSLSVPIYSIQSLIDNDNQSLKQAIKRLLEEKRYVLLSDYLRGVILKKYGGMYIDIDIAPTPSITMFLNKPELPKILGGRQDEFDMFGLQLGNGRLENGLIVSLKNNPFLNEFVVAASDVIKSNQPLDNQAIYDQAWQKYIQPHSILFNTSDNIFGDVNVDLYYDFNDKYQCKDNMKEKTFDKKMFEAAQSNPTNICYIQKQSVANMAIAIQIPGFYSWNATKNMQQLNELYSTYVQDQYYVASGNSGYWWKP